MSTHEPRNKSKSSDDARARVKEVANVSQALLGRAKKRGPLRRGRKAIDPHGAPHVVDVHVGAQLKKTAGTTPIKPAGAGGIARPYLSANSKIRRRKEPIERQSYVRN